LEQYHEDLRALRTCTLIPECISDQKQVVNFGGDGVSAAVQSATGPGFKKIHCSPMVDMLSRSGDPNRRHIDFWSLDVEGYEMTVLSGVDFRQISVSTLLVEDFWLASRELDYLLTTHGFTKYQQLSIDSLYVSRSNYGAASPWYPPTWHKDWEMNQAYRNKSKDSLKC
jgi:hypothetical protein